MFETGDALSSHPESGATLDLVGRARAVTDQDCPPPHVRARQEALAFVNRTPDDIISEILVLLVRPAHTAPHQGDLVSASHVCAHWRAVALSNPALWTEIPVRSASQAVAFFDRSCALPIRVAVGDDFRNRSPQHFTAAFQAMAPHLHRLRSLSIRISRNIVPVELLERSLRLLAPSLEELYLWVYETTGESSRGPPIFGDSFPALRSLTLSNISYHHTSPLYSNLRHLALQMQRRREGDVEELLCVLERCSGLETLELNNIRPSYGDIEPWFNDLDRPVSLPHLQSLDMVQLCHGYPRAILWNLDLPTTTRIRLEVNGMTRGDRSPPPNRHLRILEVARRHSGVTFCARQEPDPATSPFTISRFVRLKDCYVTRDGRWRGGVREMLYPDSIETYKLSVEDVSHLPHTDLQIYLYGFDALKTLCFGGHGELFCDLLRALSARFDDGTKPAYLTCPRLEALELVGPRCDKVFWAKMKNMICRRQGEERNLFRTVRLTEATGIVDAVHPLIREVRALFEDVQIVVAESNAS